MKLSKNQQHVVDLMCDGCSLWLFDSQYRHVWLQHGAVGYGGKTERVHMWAFSGLVTRKVIRPLERKWPTTEYVLTEKARVKTE